MNIPNILTIFRLILVPVFVLVYFSSLTYNLYLALIVFVVAGFTDVIDGYIARKYNLITKLGQVLDPFADKIMQLTVLACFTIDKHLPVLFIVIYGIKEMTMIIGGFLLYTKKEKVIIPANIYGKIATILFYIAIIAVALKYQYGVYLLILAILIAIFAFFKYSVIGSEKIKQLHN
ncbi:MAG: CDP-diacylglycerol--glycerol-3-phosphate 3-phosphatidyltransferase [Bacilli bacterium]|nr:CDP-diacylglycerol--glycerol-3-phosphate 3-phosphatidyltransferase [Bacilli bacterium]